MSLCWPWVFPVAGNSRCWGPSEVVSIQHSIDLAAGPKPLDQRRGQKESLLMTNNSLFNSASVFVLFYVQLCCYWWWVFFFSPSPKFQRKERHLFNSIQETASVTPSKIPIQEADSRPLKPRPGGTARGSGLCADQGLQEGTSSTPSLKRMDGCSPKWI